MRNAMMATIVLVLSSALVGGAALLPYLVDDFTDAPPPEIANLPIPAADDTPDSTDRANPEAGQAAGARTGGHVWAERLFTAGLAKDFGAVPRGTRLSYRFAVKNVYAVPVEITGLSSSCGCVTATRGRRFLQPGESTGIDVAFDTSDFTGPNTQTIRVGFGPYPACKCVLQVTAVSRSDVAFRPDRVSFGDVPRGQSPVQSIDVDYTGPLDWQIKDATVAKELPFTASVTETVRQPGKVCYRLAVTLKGDAPAGRIRGYVYLKTDQTDMPLLPLLVTANVQAPRPTASK